MFLLIILIIVVAIGGLLAYAASKPNTFRYERSIVIRATPEKLFSMISDLHVTDTWTPWSKMDPNIKKTWGGPQIGVGSTYAWEGNKQVGKGTMEIIESVPNSKVVTTIRFERPFKAVNTSETTLTPAGDSTTVTWALYGPQPMISKVMCVFMDMDKMIGKDFEKGLASLKELAER